jgi:hypothetical protein
MLRTIPPTEPVLLLATAESEANKLDPELLHDLFGFSKKNRVVVERPNKVSASLLCHSPPIH